MHLPLTLLNQLREGFVEFADGGVVWINGDYLFEVVLGFAVVFFVVVDFVQAEQGVAIAWVCNKA